MRTLVFVTVVLLAACVPPTLPPIVIPPVPPVAEKPDAPAPKPQATLAFHVVNLTGTELDGAIATVKKDGVQVEAKQALQQGYISFQLETGAFYDVTFEMEEYKTITRKFQHLENKQWEIILSRVNEPIVPKPIPSEDPIVPPTPPMVTPPAPVEDPSTWNDERWHQEFLAILKKHKAPRTVNLQTLNDTRADIEALGAEWQHTSGGELRPRLFLPVPPYGADPYSRAYDVGLYGEGWTWIKRY